MTNSQLDLTFAALSDPTRRAILARLLEGEASVAELAAPFDLTTRSISKHVSVLEAAGLILRTRTAQMRPSRIQAAPLAEIDRWLDTYRVLWNGRFDRLKKRIEKDKQK